MSDKYEENSQADVSLNDAATFLIQLEPDDPYELGRMGELLKNIADNETLPEICREKTAQAAREIEVLLGTDISGREVEVSDTLARISQLIEEAMDSDEDNKKTKTEIKKSSATAFLDNAPWHPAPTPDLLPEQSGERDPASRKPAVVPRDKSEVPPILLPADADTDLLTAFITESSELIANAEEALLALEMIPGDMDALATVFRAFHTIKGTSAFLELSLISELAHHSETFLSSIREGEIRYSGGYADLALRSVDMLKELIQCVQDVSDGTPSFKPRGYDELMGILVNPGEAGISDKSDDFPSLDIFSKDAEEAEPEAMQRESPVKNPTESEREPERGADGAEPDRLPAAGARRFVESSVRVPTDRLDRFIDMVGELVVAHSMVEQDEVMATGDYHELLKKVTLTSKIVRELQNMSMSMRMIPLKATFRKMARLVRDLARRAGKNVRLITEGEDTEIDRNMVDILSDPLVHMIRNAVDHGIEMPDVREGTGKTRYGVLKLSARHSAGNVVVEIRDDGKGLDRQEIFAKAVEKGFVSGDSDARAISMSDRDLFSLIFEPGFSTAKAVTEVSGRGVGMNVVKTNIEALRGQIEIHSEKGAGSVFRLGLPLTLAIIDGMVVRVGREKYVMPTVSIVRSVRPESRDLSTALGKGEMMTLQGKLVPLFRLADLFRITGAEQDPTQAIVMVVEDNERQAGVVVDELIGSQQIVIKTLGETMRNIPGISGSAIMPNGRVGLILDVGGLVRLANSGGRSL